MPAPKNPLPEPWPAELPFPPLMSDRDLMRVVQLRPSAFYLHKKHGRFHQLEANGVRLGTTKYSGELVRDYVTRIPLAHFGRGRQKGVR